MARAADAFAPSGKVERGRGGFYRNSLDIPFITDPLGALTRSGERKGLPKWIPYGSPSNFAKLIENTFNLQKWGERRSMLGVGLDPELYAACGRLAFLDVDSDEFKAEADRIVIAAKAAAQTSLAADRGTHGHAITEDDDEGRDWIARAEKGELLGLSLDVQRSLVQAWRDMLVREGLEILVTEASCVDDTWHLAGTLDNLARLTRSLRFRMCTGEIREIPAGTVVVLDKKTGQRRTNAQGVIQYWQGYAVQVASYAQSVPYDTAAETRNTWEWPIDQTHALIAHLDVLGAIDGRPSCELVYVDLVAGREHGGSTVVAAKEWGNRADIFSVAEIDTQPKPCRRIRSARHNRSAGELQAQMQPARSERIGTAESAPEPSRPTPGQPVSGPAEEVALPDSSAGPDPFDGLAEPEPVALARASQREPRSRIPSRQIQIAMIGVKAKPAEGAKVGDLAYLMLSARYMHLDAEPRAWVNDRAREANTWHVGFHLKELPSVRRFRLMRALIMLAPEVHHDDEFVRALLALQLGDVAHFPSLTLGHIIGSLNAAEARSFCGMARRFMRGQYVTAHDGEINALQLQPA